MTPTILLPHNALIVLVGPAGCGKSTFAAKHFRPTEVVSSDAFREMISDDATNQDVSADAFDLFYRLIHARLKHDRLTVADATNLTKERRAELRGIATTAGRPCYALVVETTLEQSLTQNAQRARRVPEHVIASHWKRYEESLLSIFDEGFAGVLPVNADSVIQIGTTPNRTAPGWDVIGDVHGCLNELLDLLHALGYQLVYDDVGRTGFRHPEGRRLAFVGDLTDRGPFNLGVLRVAKFLLDDGHVIVRGNHDHKLLRALKGNKITVGNGLAGTLKELEAVTQETRTGFQQLLEQLPYYARLGISGELGEFREIVVAHAGLQLDSVGRVGRAVESHCIYGEVEGFENGIPIRGHRWRTAWAQAGDKHCVFGHTPVDDVDFREHSVNIDTGCVFGGRLTALRFPEYFTISVPALQRYAER